MFSFFKKLTRGQSKTLLIVFFAFFCNGSLSLLLGSVMPDLKSTYGLSDTFSGMLISAHSFGNLIAGFVAGVIPLYLGKRRSIMATTILAFIGYGMTLITGQPLWLLVAIAFVGMGRGSITNFNSQTINNLTNGSPTASNLGHASFAVGAILLPMIFLFLRNNYSWHWGVVYVMALYLVLEVLWLHIEIDDDRPMKGTKKNTTLVFMRNRSYLIFAMMMFCYLCSEYAINGWLVTYIQNKENLLDALAASGMSVTAYSQSMATLLWTVIMIGRLICAAISARFGVKKLMFLSACGMAVFFAGMLFSSTIPMVTICVSFMGLFMSGICPMIYSDAVDFTNRYPLAVSMLLGIGSIGAIAMPTIVGSLAERFGFTGGMSAILVMVILLVVFSAMNFFMKPVPASQEQ